MPRVDILNPAAVAWEIQRLSELLEARTEEYAADAEASAIAEAAYKRRWAEEYLDIAANAEGRSTVAEREARCEVRTNPDRQTAGIAEAKLKATKAALDTIRSQLDSLRTLAASLRSQT